MACARLTLWLATVLHALLVNAGVASSPSDDGKRCPLAALVEDSSDEPEAISLIGTSSRQLLNSRGPLPPLIFVKVHKVGGSTMCNILQRVAAREHLQPVLPTDGGVINWQTLETLETASHQYDIVFNHEMLNVTAARRFLKPNPFFLSIVREPVAMIDSRFRWHRGPRTWAGRLKQMRRDPSNYMNPIARDFGWYDSIDLRRQESMTIHNEIFRRDDDPAAIDAFVQQLNRTMDFVFPTENYDEGLILLMEHLPLSLDDLIYVRQKVSVSDPIPPPTPEEEKALRKYVGVDTLIYQTFLQRFEEQRRLAEERHPQQLQSQLQELQRRNEEIQRACDATPADRTLCTKQLTMTPGEFNFLHFEFPSSRQD